CDHRAGLAALPAGSRGLVSPLRPVGRRHRHSAMRCRRPVDVLGRTPGQFDGGRRAGGYRDCERELSAFALPIHRDGPQRALVASPGPAQRRVRYWPDGEGPPSGRTWILLEPEGVRVQEADHTAFAVVVERLVCLSLLVNPFPVLPDGGRALV